MIDQKKQQIITELRNTANLIETGQVIVTELAYAMKMTQAGHRADTLSLTFEASKNGQEG